MQISKPIVIAAVVAALGAVVFWARADAEATAGRAVVTSIVEAHDVATDRGILYVGGKRLTRFRKAELLGEFGQVIAELEIIRKTGAELTIGLPADQSSSGSYQLRLSARRGDPCVVPFSYRNTYVDFDRLSSAGFVLQTENPFQSIWGINFGDGYGVTATAQSDAPAAGLKVERTSSSGDLAHFVRQDVIRARIDEDGTGFFNGGTQTGGADFAESVSVNAPKREFEPGDVMVIDPMGERRFALSRTADSPLVAGIYSTRPGVLARPGDVAGSGGWTEDEVPLAITGIVPCKVCDEGGPVRAGDLLVAASVPGHAKRAPENPRAGTLVGKALGRLTGRRGKVEVLITMR